MKIILPKKQSKSKVKASKKVVAKVQLTSKSKLVSIKEDDLTEEGKDFFNFLNSLE